MAKQRFINTKLWSDSWIRKLNPLDRFLFLYFLTNEHTNIAGIYEVALETIAFETGIELDTLSKSMLSRLEPKVFYIDGWVCITNFEKHQRVRGNDKIAKGIEAVKTDIPSHILEKFKQKTDSLSKTTNYSDIDSDSDLRHGATRKDAKKAKHNPLSRELIKAFESIDPKNKDYYKNNTQLSACDFLIKEYGLEEVRKRVSFLPRSNKLPYFPTITTPVQLRDKWVQLQDAVERKRGEIKSKVQPII